MERESFVFYRSFYEAIQDLDAEQTRELVLAICERALNGNDVETKGIVKMAYNLIRPQLDANNKKYTDGCKGGRPPKNWDNSQKPKVSEKITSGYENGKPNDNVNDNVNENVNENEKGLQGETLDANASRGTVEKKSVGKTNGKTLKDKLIELGLEDEVIDLAITYDSCKKGKKLSKFQDAQLKIRVNKLRTCGFETIEGMKQVLENSIAGGYEGIFPLKQKPQPKQKIEEGKVVNVGGANIFF